MEDIPLQKIKGTKSLKDQLAKDALYKRAAATEKNLRLMNLILTIFGCVLMGAQSLLALVCWGLE